ncbi:MAG: polysaccharide biosynthesis tyrosine autokinase [Actinomycetota bacterium]
MMYQTDTRQTADVARLEDYLQAFRQRRWLVLSFLALGILLAFFYTQTAPVTYTATSEVRVGPTPFGSTNNNLVAAKLEEESKVVSSDIVAEQVTRSFPATDRTQLDVKFTQNSNILVISYTAAAADQAAAVANAFAQAYTDQRIADAEAFYQTRIAANETRLADIEANVAAAEDARQQITNRRATVFEQPASEARANELEQLAAEISQANTEVNSLRSDANQARTAIRTDETSIATLAGSPPAELLSTATAPSSADGIPSSLLLVAGAIVGFVLGLVTAFFLERLDTTARDENDVALALGTSVIGAIPALGGMGRLRPSNSLIMFSTGGSARIAAAREAFRRLRSSLLFLNTSNGVSSAVVTSSAPGEGKSVTSANLAIALAQNGSRVVLVSGDMRRPTLERMFGMEAQRPGLAEYLGQTAELNAEKVPGIENLWLIRSGRPPANPSELLNSDRFELLIKELEREDVEYIIVDSPPVLSTADALSAARYVDGVIVVVDAEQTDTSDLLQVRADLERTGAKLLGAVLNRRQLEQGGLFRRSKYAYYHAEASRID